MLFALADRLRMIPSELARRLTRAEFAEMIAYAEIRKERDSGSFDEDELDV